jgi:hypothetical protein
VMDITRISLRQTITPDRWQGRTHSSLRVVEVGGLLLGALLGGWLGQTIGLRATIVVAAVGTMAAGLPVLFARVGSTGTIHATMAPRPRTQSREDDGTLGSSGQ